MSSIPIGRIVEINRYPVKSFAGESLNRVNLESYGMHGDRSHAFVDKTKEGWSRYITARKYPEMLRYRAVLETELTDHGIPQVKIIFPDGRIYPWNDQLLTDIYIFTNHQNISLESYNLKSIKPEEQLAVDDGSILIITEQSLKKLERIWGKSLDKRRFRSNFLLCLFDDLEYSESDFIGKQLIIGNAQLAIKSLCERCSMITIDPDTLERDSSLLQKVHKNLNLNFGMYADVEQIGTVQVGDQVYLMS